MSSGTHPQSAADLTDALSMVNDGYVPEVWGVTINDVMMHPGMLDAPFGGIGASGTGHYNGREGFLEFSHARTVFVAPDQDPRREWGMLPPYGDGYRAAMDAQVTP